MSRLSSLLDWENMYFFWILIWKKDLLFHNEYDELFERIWEFK